MQKTGKDIKKNSLDKYCDVHTLALYLNMTPRRVQQLVNRGVIPKGHKRGEYEFLTCLHCYQRHLKSLVFHFAGFYSGKGGKSELKERNRVEQHIYSSAAREQKGKPVISSGPALIADLTQLTFFNSLEDQQFKFESNPEAGSRIHSRI